jgi:hypothetical protein
MFGDFNKMFGQKTVRKGGPMIPETPSALTRNAQAGPVFTKVFRWRLPDGQVEAPQTVEVAGSFNGWERVPMTRDSAVDAWHVTLHHIPGHRTHHYMLLVDGKPIHDKACDGLAVPHGPIEEQFALPTDKGPRVFMLFAQTK